MNTGKQYQVRDYVKNNAADKKEVAEILAKNPLWKAKHARDLLARRRMFESGKAGKAV